MLVSCRYTCLADTVGTTVGTGVAIEDAAA